MRRVVLALLLCVSCLDKAKADWDRCVERDRAYDTAGAASACAAAVAADPKSSSGQAAADKLLTLQGMLDKMKAEHDDKVARDDAIKRAALVAPAVTTTVTAVATVAPPQTPLEQAQTLVNAGDSASARTLLETRMTQKPTRDEASLLSDICKTQHDSACVAKIKKLLPRLH